ncbi:unnamed protein product [Cyclocybe aegerita]|uniref:NmrA-like domain-containing protein n=1 Tax=Cyclocybe aegerita TaxID=1973307 RepID=A0A8S0WAS6_CYCAE|nr:unnamed protein product [Cyclocybe aegerita]
MSSSRTVTVLGFGNIARDLVPALLSNGAGLLILSHDASKLKGVPLGVATAMADYTNEKQLEGLFKAHKVEAVVSTASGSDEFFRYTQVGIARAAKESGVQLFVTNEFGVANDGHDPKSVFGAKSEAAARISKEVGLPTARVFNGLFIEWIPIVTAYASKPGAFVVAGKGDTKASFTAIADIAGFVAHIVTAAPLSEISNRIFLIEGQVATFNEIAQILGREVTYTALEEIADPISRLLQRGVEEGWMRTGAGPGYPPSSSKEIERRSSS